LSFSDWLLSLHLLSAFALVSGVVAIAAVNVAAVRRDRPSEIALLMRLGKVPQIVLQAGLVGVLVFGIWLAIDLDQYSITDGWILASIAVWIVGSALGGIGGARAQRVHVEVERVAAAGDVATPELLAQVRDRSRVALHTGSGLATLLILILMIWKPGA
jgi:uncharacterized membrane protein